MTIFMRITIGCLAALAMLSLPTTALGDTSDWYRESYRLEAKGQYAAAYDLMVKIRATAGESYFLLARTGWLAYNAGRHAESQAAYAQAIAAKPQAIEPRLGLTLPLLAEKKWRELELACREVLKLDPKNEAARARMAHAHYSVGNYPDSATLYRQLVAEYPGNLNHQTGLGWALARMGRIGEAKKIFTAVLAVSPDNVNAKQGLALR